jgi:hypothetical protein
MSSIVALCDHLLLFSFTYYIDLDRSDRHLTPPPLSSAAAGMAASIAQPCPFLFVGQLILLSSPAESPVALPSAAWPLTRCNA